MDRSASAFITHGTPALVLAPMDGVTDPLMRQLLCQMLPLSYCVSEFVRVSNTAPPVHLFLREVPELYCGGRTISGTAMGTPVQVQILGGDPDLMATAAERAVSAGASAIDINFGCPAPTVNRHDGGAAILRAPERIERIVRAVRSAVPRELPVSAKLRLGWDDPAAIHRTAECAALGGASWITIHGRTKTQGYTPPAYWEPIGEVRRALDIPVVANGEIWNADDLKRCREITGCEHFMLGRGVLADPGMVPACAHELGLPTVSPMGIRMQSPGSDSAGWTPFIAPLISLSMEYGEEERRTLARVKQWLNYARHRREMPWFDVLKRFTSVFELCSFLDLRLAGCSLGEGQRETLPYN